MVQRFWLQDDQRDRSYNWGESINDIMLTESYAVQENQLELVTVIAGLIKCADRPKYVGNNFYEGRIVSLPKAERSMPEQLTAGIELAECKVTLCNIDSALTKYLPGGDEYKTFYGQDVAIYMGLRDVESSLIPIFSGTISPDNGVTYTINDVNFKFRDRLDNLNTKFPLETITKEAYLNAPDSSIGKLIPIALGDFIEGWEFTENGTTSYRLVENNLTVINMTPVGMGGGLPSYYVGGGFFLFSTGGRAGKTYNPTDILDVMIKRGNNYLWADFTTDAVNVAGHWCVHVGGIKGRDTEGNIVVYSYEYNEGDEAIIKTRIPINEDWDDLVDTNPIDQSIEALIAMGRISETDFDYDSIATIKEQLSELSGLKQKIRFSFNATVNGYSLIGKVVYFYIIDVNEDIIPMAFWFQSFISPIPPDDDPRMTGKNPVIITVLDVDYTAAETCELIKNALEANEYIYTNTIVTMNNPSDNEGYLMIENILKGECTEPDPLDSGFIVDITALGSPSEPIRTRIWFGSNDSILLDAVSGLLKCCLVDIYVNKDLKIAYSSSWPQSWPGTSQMTKIYQYDISEKTIDISSEPKAFLTCAQANYGWVYWLNSASTTTKKRKNQNAENKIQRTIIKEFDLPNIYREKDVIPILDTYIRLASAALITIKMQLGWKHLLRDLAEFVSLNIKIGSLDFTNVPCQIRKISILPNVCGSEVELLCFINFSYPNYTSPSDSRNLSSYDIFLSDV